MVENRLTFHAVRNRLIALVMLPINIVVYAIDAVIGGFEKLIGSKRMPYFFMAPNMLIFVIFILLPVILNFAFGFTIGDTIRLSDRPFVGWDNFEKLLTCGNYLDVKTCEQDLFWRAFRNSGIFVAIEVPLLVLAALGVALALNRQIIARGFFRSAFFYPVLLSPVVVAIIWKWILQDRSGLLNTVVKLLGGTPLQFLTGDSTWAMFWIVFVSVWSQVGFFALILLAGLQSIPPVLYEAATIDGATAWGTFTGVTLPLLRPTMLVVVVLALIRGVQAFDVIFVLTGGGPGTSTLLMVQYIYNTAFGMYNWGLAAAASLIMALVLAVLTLAQLFLNRNQTEAI